MGDFHFDQSNIVTQVWLWVLFILQHCPLMAKRFDVIIEEENHKYVHLCTG